MPYIWRILVLSFKNDSTGFREQEFFLQVISANAMIAQKKKMSIIQPEGQNENNKDKLSWECHTQNPSWVGQIKILFRLVEDKISKY